LRNLFESTQVPTVFLDHDLVIRTFTPAVSQIFNIIPGDRGRPLTDLTSRIPVPDLADDVRKVFADGQPIERRIERTPDADHFLVRVLPYRDDNNRIDGVIVTFVDVTSLSLAEAHQRVLIAELNHRVKNMLTVVIAIAEQTLRTAPTIEGFKTSFVARVHAMSRAYELLSRDNWVSVSLRELVHEELSPFGMERVSMVGPDLLLGPRRAISIGMILHELCTNAVRYGALSIDAGRLALNWTVLEAAGRSQLVVHWQESGGPPVQEPANRGLGLKLVERETSYNLGGKAQIEFAPTGLSASLEFDLYGKIE
jgi:two-component system CheB/CheR fusion protein